MTRPTRELLGEALAHFEVLLSHAEHDLSSQLVIDAVCMRLSAGLEVLNRLSHAERSRLFGEDWQLMWGMRNRIAHGYLLVNAEIVHETLATDVPSIVDRIQYGLRQGRPPR